VKGNYRIRWYVPAAAIFVLVVGLTCLAIGQAQIIPANLVTREWTGILMEEGYQISECAECHASDDFHSCETCHGDHGEVVLADVPFSSIVALAGDVPQPAYIPIHQIMPASDGRQSHYSIQSLLAEYGVDSFASVTLSSNDGGFITLLADELTDQAYLLPYVDGLRFICEDLHASTWLKGITRIIVVQNETPLSINGQETSIGRILLGRTVMITVEETSVMLQSEEDGQLRTAMTASRVEGASLSALFGGELPLQVQILDAAGAFTLLSRADLEGALLAQFHGQTTLVLPSRARQQWIMGVVSISGVN